MNISLDASISITGLFPSPPGAGPGHPFELRAGPYFGGELQVVSLRGRERINDVYRYEVTFATDQPPELVTSALFGLPACLGIKAPGHDPRVIQGVCSAIEAIGGVPGERGGKRRRFRLEIVPRLWLTRHRRKNRVFQNKSVPDIVDVILRDVGIQDTDCHWRIHRASYPPLPFVYQRDESDYDFFRRVLASAGIFFFFEHPNGLLDSMMPGADAIAGAVGAAAGMLGGAVASAVGSVEAATGMVTVLNFGDAPGHTAAVTGGVAGLVGDALSAGIGAAASALGGAAGAVVNDIAGAIEEPSDTLAFDDGIGANAEVERVYEFGLKKLLRTKELRLVDRDVEGARSWVGVASVAPVTASLDLSVGVSLVSGALSGGLSGALSGGLSASFDVDAPTIPPSDLRQELYQVDSSVWCDPKPDTRMDLELARTRMKYQQAIGRSDCRRLGAGYRFGLGGHPIQMLNGEYTVTSLDVRGIHPDFAKEGDALYRNRFTCIPSAVAPLPQRPAPRPRPGMEVALVVGFVGSETLPAIEANPAGYVRVRFRWDILDDKGAQHGSLDLGTDDVHAVWIPIVQPWAGAGYGAQFIPRPGMEVLVGFLDDQGERPVILGCVHSDASPPPWPAYIDHQKVGIRSETRPANGGYSELSIDDRQGAEVVQFRAQKDMREDVLNDRVTNITHDRSTTIGHDSVLAVNHDRSVSVTNNQSHTTGGTDTVTVIGDVTHDLRANVTLSVKGATNETLFGDLQRTLASDVHVDTVGETHLTFKGDYTERHKGHRTVIVGAGGAHRSAALHVEGDARAYAAKAIEIESLEGLSIICGDSQLLISPKGITLSTPTLTLAGKEIDANAGTIAVASTGDLTLGGKTTTVQTAGAKLALDSSSASLTASQVKLGSGSGASAQTNDKPATITKIQMKDPTGKPRANARVLLTKGGKDGEQRMTVLDENGMLEIIGTDSYTVTFPDDAQAK